MGDNDVLGFAGWDNYYCNRCKCTHYKEECPLAKREGDDVKVSDS